MKSTVSLHQWFHDCDECGERVSGIDEMTLHHKLAHSCQLTITFTGIDENKK